MGKAYQSTQSNYIDFIADPNFDVQMKLADQQVKEQYARSSLLNAAPDIQIDSWDEAHKDLVSEKKQAYQDRIEDITRNIYDAEDVTNINKFMPQLKSLKRELTEDFTKGDLYNIQKTAETHKKFTEELNKIKDPARRQAYINAYEQKYLSGDKKKAFEYSPLQDTRNIDAEFLNSSFFKSLPEQVRSSVGFDPIEGGLLMKEGQTVSQKTKEDIEKAYKQFVTSDSSIKSYAQEAEGVLGETGWLKEGELDLSETGRLGQSMRSIGETRSYKNVRGATKSFMDDPRNFENELKIAGMTPKKRQTFFGTHLEGEWTLTQTTEGRELVKANNKAIEDMITSVSSDAWKQSYVAADAETKATMLAKKREEALTATIKVDGKEVKHPIAEKLEELDNAFQSAIDFGTRKYASLLSAEEHEKFKKSIASGVFLDAMKDGQAGYVRYDQDDDKATELLPKIESLDDLVGTTYNNKKSPYYGKKILKVVPLKKDGFYPGGQSFKRTALTGGTGFFNLVFEDLSPKEYDEDGNLIPKEDLNEERIQFYAPEMELKPYIAASN